MVTSMRDLYCCDSLSACVEPQHKSKHARRQTHISSACPMPLQPARVVTNTHTHRVAGLPRLHGHAEGVDAVVRRDDRAPPADGTCEQHLAVAREQGEEGHGSSDELAVALACVGLCFAAPLAEVTSKRALAVALLYHKAGVMVANRR